MGSIDAMKKGSDDRYFGSESAPPTCLHAELHTPTRQPAHPPTCPPAYLITHQASPPAS